MNRIYQGRARRAELIDDKGHPVAAPANWDGLDALWQHHALFQDAVNYYVVCLLALAQPGSALWPIREKLDAKNEAGGDDELMVWRTFRRRGAMRRGLRDSVVPYICPDKKDATPEDCFAAVLAGNECAQSEERKKRLDAGLRQILKNCTGESGCRDSSKEYLPRLCRTKTRCNYPESAISRRRAYHEQLLPLVLHSAVSASSEVWKGFNTFSIALPDYEKPFYAGDEAKQLLRKMIADLRAKFSKDAADFARLAAVVDAKSPATRIPGYAATSAKEEKKFRLYAMYLFRYVERSEFTLRLLRATTPAPEKDARFAHTVHSEPRPDSALFDEFDTEVIAKCDKTKPVFGADEAAAKLQQMVDEWRGVLPDPQDDWQPPPPKAAVVQ
ncbi:MAG TPA: hypothetical protein PKE47_08115, partial [Verrucomicrobiota bacterium]|nr:hypothetical protein [Verrucomicrobiota bacterium]